MGNETRPVVPGNQTPTSRSKQLETSLDRMAEAATDARYPKALTRAMVLELGPEEETRSALKSLILRTEGAPKAVILSCLVGLEVMFPSQALDVQQKEMRYRIYCDALKDVPEDVLKKACKAYVATPGIDGRQKFFPQPGDLLALCKDEMKEVRRARLGVEKMQRALDTASSPVGVITADRATAVIEATRKKYHFHPERQATAPMDEPFAPVIAREITAFEKSRAPTLVETITATLQARQGNRRAAE